MRRAGRVSSRFGWSGLESHPTNSKLIIVFVVGGVTASEIRELRELASQHAEYQVMVGSTCLADAELMYQLVLETRRDAA